MTESYLDRGPTFNKFMSSYSDSGLTKPWTGLVFLGSGTVVPFVIWSDTLGVLIVHRAMFKGTLRKKPREGMQP